MEKISIQDAAQALVLERFEQLPEMWHDGYNYDVEYDQVDIFLNNDSQLSITFYDDHATVRGKRTRSARFEYADPNFDDRVLMEIRQRLNI